MTEVKKHEIDFIMTYLKELEKKHKLPPQLNNSYAIEVIRDYKINGDTTT